VTRALITGAEGQDGSYLTEILSHRGVDITATALHPVDARHIALDVTDAEAVKDLVAQVRPNVIFHLAAVSSTTVAQANPELAHSVNVEGLRHVLDAVKSAASDAHVINASSVEVFAPTSDLISEQSVLGGLSTYAKTKQEALQIARQSSQRVASVIMSNHESPLRGAEFVSGKIARGVAAIALGSASTIEMGDLTVQRDWSFAGDIVQGMVKVMDRRFTGDVILASGVTRPLRDLVAAAFAAVEIHEWIQYVRHSTDLVRSEASIRRFDVSRARGLLDWSADTPLELWMADMVNFHLANEQG
jgi:GDPmannose 4,6-dehydratase